MRARGSRTTAVSARGPQSPESHHRRDIQGLRALAVALVIANHASALAPGGFIGVDVFFVISGYVITRMLLREVDRTGRVRFADFYLRRARRILPAGLIVIAVTVMSAAAWFPIERATSVMWDGFWAALFAANWNLVAQNADYFAGGLATSPLQHYWSLSIEEQFYLAWPWLVVIAVAGVATARRRLRVVLAIGIPLAASLAWSLLQTIDNPSAAYFSSVTRFWELGLGGILAFVLARRSLRLSAMSARSLGYVGLTVIAVCAFAYSSETPFPGLAALAPTLATCAVIAAGSASASARYEGPRLLTNRVAVYLGDISYSLYLWHLPAIIISEALWGAHTLVVIGAIATTLMLSITTYHLIEQPFRRMGRSLGVRRRGASPLVAVLLGVALVAGVSVSAIGLGDRAEQRAAQAEQPVADAGMADRCRGVGYLDPASQPCDLAEIPLRPTVDDFQADIGSAEDLACRRGDKGDPVSCTFGDADAEYRVALIGDSHAGTFLPAVRALAEAHGWSVTTFIGWNCQWSEQSWQDCGNQIAEANADFTDGTAYDVILSAGARTYNSRWPDEKVAASAQMMADAVAAGNRVVQLEDVPIPSEDSLLCVQRPGFDPLTSDCGTPLAEGVAQPDRLAEAARMTPGATVVSFNDLICPDGQTCPAVLGQTVTFRDTIGHLTITFADTLTDALMERVFTDAPRDD